MKTSAFSGRRIALLISLLALTTGSFAQNPEHSIASLLEVQQYDRAIHIMAMLLLGFGFLMVFVHFVLLSCETHPLTLLKHSLITTSLSLTHHCLSHIKKILPFLINSPFC